MAKTLKLGKRLRYPITISKLLKNVGDNVVKQESILQYTFKFERKIGDPTLGEERTIFENGIADWDSPTEGEIKSWLIKEGQVINADQDFVGIEETCGHEMQMAGMCAICGKDMKEQNWASETLDTDRATVSMVHDNVALTVSQAYAERTEMQSQRRLLKDRKLSLVVDLDQTIIHACIEPTVGEWQQDPTNPNYEAVKEVRRFQLDDGPRGLASGCWYYIKLRPGLTEFLEQIAKLFELHVYTMGTRAYALNIAKIVDPTQKLFGNRIISRDENGSMTAKTLQRLFPFNVNMVAVIDDRADVWPNDRSHLIKVTPYDFFKGIGDINSSFLPKREDIINAAPAPQAKPTPPNSSTHGSTDSSSEKEKALDDNTSKNLLQIEAEEQERILLEKQVTDRPLLHLQEELDREDEEADKESNKEGNDQNNSTNGTSETPSHHRHNLLRDDDQELLYLEKHLSSLHQAFYQQYDASVANKRSDEIAPSVVPNAGNILNFLKNKVLGGTRIVLSGIVPLGQDLRKAEIVMQAVSFGAEIRTRITPDVTHLVIHSARPRTQKVRQAAKIPSIKIVNQNWLADSLAQWEALDTTPYLVEVHPVDRDTQDVAVGKPISTDRAAYYNLDSSTTALETGAHVEDAEDADESADDDEAADGGDEETKDLHTFALPADLDDGMRSPIENLNKMGWDDVDKELEEFMGSDVESDMESNQGTDRGMDTDTEEPKGTKRKVADLGDDSGAEGVAGSTLAKKQRMARARTTALRNVRNAGDEDGEGSGLPTPLGTGDEEDAAGGEGKSAGDDDGGMDEEDQDDLADLLEAELEAEFAADEEMG
ncbi:hypothetical protein F5Y16DRAFT_357800 [Xylariaceae sp. FL0255]|nr:hypothetical protein F5Y16DRAFT_357800 [Xylariaceae sp. FL0255]